MPSELPQPEKPKKPPTQEPVAPLPDKEGN